VPVVGDTSGSARAEVLEPIVVEALNKVVAGGVRCGELGRGDRMLRWVEAGSGEPPVILDAGLGEPGSLAWAAVMPVIATHARVIAYDRAGTGRSDPVSPLTLRGEVDDLAALAREAGGGPCILVGHSWGGLLAQLTAFAHPDLIAGLVLVDPAHEEMSASAPLPFRIVDAAMGFAIVLLHSLGLLRYVVRRSERPFARLVSADPIVQSLFLDAYVSCYSNRTQARMLRAEGRMANEATTQIRKTRAASALPDVPVVTLSATRGLPSGMRTTWTGLQAGLTEGRARGEHFVVMGSAHAIHQQVPERVIVAIDHVREQLNT
jgi:pimeloyl-ACP methyl ester carboxylesterase